MDRVDISLKKEGLIMKANGETIKWKAKDKHILKKDKLNILENGNLMNITVGEFFTQILS